ncbi:RING-type E3 ubiquitin transferase [Heracleum sosnowskyi]|uniref:RING-type E3 ubiquitin transferase n=1 Tax=Heracleum sosnowskyi TaxID=360622 RepID=A0AAD8GZM0_9APIA|nr:RING-type E3 ubiquitin transferase [Heracleum sosnowskyi]
MLACFGFGRSQPRYPFTSFVVKVDPSRAGESSVAEFLKQTNLEISSIQMHGDGVSFQISGPLNPKLLIKVLQKTDKTPNIVSLQVGGYFRNLHLPEFEQRQRYRHLRATKTKKRNSAKEKTKKTIAPDFFDGCSLVFNDGKPSLSFQLLDTVKKDIELTCPIFLDIVYDAAASVTIVDELKEAKSTEKCAVCREVGVYEGAIHLENVNNLLSRSSPEYWEECRQSERVERTEQPNEH